MSLLEISAVILSALGVWLTTRRMLVSWPTGILACALYVVVFYRARLYSDMLLQGVYIAICFYGWWHWKQSAQEEGEIQVENLSFRGWIIGIILGAVASIFLGTLMARYTNAALPYWDSSLTSFSLVAQAWATRKYIANWWLWIAVDIAYVGVFLYKHLYLTSGLYAAFVILAVLGLYSWTQALHRDLPQIPSESIAPASQAE